MQRTMRLFTAIAVSASLTALVSIGTADARIEPTVTNPSARQPSATRQSGARQSVTRPGSRKVGKRRGRGLGYGPYGFLPGVRSPEAIELDFQMRQNRQMWYGYNPYTGAYGPVGVATFYRGRWNGGS